MPANNAVTKNNTSVTDVTLSDQAELGNFFREMSEEEQNSAVFDSASNVVRESLPPVLKSLMGNLPDQVQKTGHQAVATQKIILDCVLNRRKMYEQEYGHSVPDAVYDGVLRQALPLVDQNYAKQLGFYDETKKLGLFDEVSNVSGGAMSVNQVATAIMLSFGEQIPFGGVAAVGNNGNGLEGRIIQVTHSAQSDVGGYKRDDNLDGLNAGKPYLQSKRFADAVLNKDKPEYTAKITLKEGDQTGCAIRSDTATVYINGLIAVAVNPSNKNGSTFVGSGHFKFPDKDTVYIVSMNCTDSSKGEITISIDKPLPEGTQVRVSADVDYEHSSLKGSRPSVKAQADFTSFRIHYASGYYKVSSEAKQQWQSDVHLDPATQATIALRNQYYIERYLRAIDCMYEIAQSYQTDFKLDFINRLSQRSISSVVQDLFFGLSQVDTSIVMRSQFSSLGVIYVGQSAIQYFDAMDPSIFTKSGLRKRPGIFRIGKWCGLYDVYYTPSPKLNRPTRNSFQMLCIGRSDQVAGNPYITGDAMAPLITPFSINNDGENGSFFFGALNDTVNPFPNIASAAALINVTDTQVA